MNTLADRLAHLDELDEDKAIYATPRWRASSETVVELEPHDGSVPVAASGMTFLVSVSAAKAILQQRASWRPGRPLSLAEKCKAIIYFAVYDEAEPPPSIYAEAGAA